MTQAQPMMAPEISAFDRLGFTLFLSVVLNAIVILGISFTVDDDFEDKMAPILDITLVATSTEDEPDEADYLAQSNQKGAGELEDKKLITTPSPALMSTADDSSAPLFLPKMQEQAPPENTETDVLTADKNETKIYTEEQDPTLQPEITTPTAVELIARSQQIAKLSAELDEQVQAYAKKPRKVYLNHLSTKKYKYATYFAEWQRKIERIGKLNFPDEAKRKKLGGSLLLDVALSKDGLIAGITIRRSSGHKLLDDAAIRIVRLAAPFSHFPKEFREETDIIHITRTWQFLPEGRVYTRKAPQ